MLCFTDLTSKLKVLEDWRDGTVNKVPSTKYDGGQGLALCRHVATGYDGTHL